MNSNAQFVDTGFFIALANTRDALHARARRLAAGLRRRQITTDAILLEVGDALAGSRLRAIGVALLEDIRTNPEIEVVPLSPDLLDRAVLLYRDRPDKEWGLTDCISFIVMQDRGLTEAYTADQHFIQAGFRALLREDV